MKLGRLRLLGRDLGHPIGRWSNKTTGLGARHDRILLVYTYKNMKKLGKTGLMVDFCRLWFHGDSKPI